MLGKLINIDRVHFYVEDARKWRDWFVRVMGFQAIASGRDGQTQTEVVSTGMTTDSDRGSIVFVLCSALTSQSPVADFLRIHPPGVADVAFAVKDLASVLEGAIACGATLKSPIQEWQSSQGQLRWSQIVGIAGLTHTLIERHGMTPILPENWIVEKPFVPQQNARFTGIDHLVLNVATGELDATVCWYERVLGFQRQQTFTIQTENSGLYSQVMVHPSSAIQFPLNEPLGLNSQIQEFIDINRGAGIQHIALKTPRILEVSRQLRRAGLSFLDVPRSYYQSWQRQYPDLMPQIGEWEALIEQGILIDGESQTEGQSLDFSENNPLLLQIFTQPIFAKPTFFFELIERRDRAQGFGEGNFRALFEAIEREQRKRGKLTE